jgi:hypothetical protein
LAKVRAFSSVIAASRERSNSMLRNIPGPTVTDPKKDQVDETQRILKEMNDRAERAIAEQIGRRGHAVLARSCVRTTKWSLSGLWWRRRIFRLKLTCDPLGTSAPQRT